MESHNDIAEGLKVFRSEKEGGTISKAAQEQLRSITGQVQRAARRMQVREIPIANVLQNPHQPRRTMNPESIAALADSIEEHGLLHPVVTTHVGEGGNYTLLVGHRRLAAFEYLGRDMIPAIQVAAKPEDHALVALVENLNREDLHPLEEAQGFNDAMEARGLTQTQLAASVGRSEGEVSRTLGLLRLADDIQQEWLSDWKDLAKYRVYEVAQLPPEEQRPAWEAVIKRHRAGMPAPASVSKADGPARKLRPSEVMRLGRKFRDETQIERIDPENWSKESRKKVAETARVALHFWSAVLSKIED